MLLIGRTPKRETRSAHLRHSRKKILPEPPPSPASLPCSAKPIPTRLLLYTVMPSDIRSFFGGKGGGASIGGNPNSETKNDVKASGSKPKARGKRKVLSDSEDDGQEASNPSPKKPPPKRKPPSPKPEETTASDYFATTKKPLRSTPSKQKQSGSGHPAITKEVTSNKPSSGKPKAGTPKKAAAEADQATPARSVRSSTRSKKRQSYSEAQVSDDDRPILVKDEDDSGEDIYQAEFKPTRGKAADDYESDDGSADDPLPKKANQRSSNGQKRKTDMLSDAEELDGPAKSRKGAASSTPKGAPKKGRATPQKKAPPPEDTEMQDIFDKIPTVRPPTPPPREDNKKFDFKANAGRSQAAPLAGSKAIPEGAEACLSGRTFVFTGLLDSLGRDEGQTLVKRYGGKVTTTPSFKTSYVVLGNDAGPKKLETIANHKLKTINEEGLFALIRTMPAHGGSGVGAAKALEKREAEEKKVQKAAKEMEKQMALEEEKRSKKRTAAASRNGEARPKNAPRVEDRLWTTKYAPTQTGQICGNKAAVDKLQTWLRNWQKSAKSNFKKGGPDGSGLYRSVMLHGSPGIGKTTAAHLVANLEGYDVVESNASDVRSKRIVESGLKGVLDTTSLFGYLPGSEDKIEASKKKLVLIMDEVDGMSAGDRGGVGAMASICRKTRIPIILICNERKLPKMKPFDHTVFDIPFRKPTTDQIRSRIMTILFREGMKDMIPINAVNALIEGAGADIRRIINMISTVKLDQSTIDFDQGKKMTSAWEKNVVLRPWDIVQKILGSGMFAQNSNATLNDKTELYFNDHDFSYLMLQENYLVTNPVLAFGLQGREKSTKILELVDQAAESISDGDLVDSMIHGSQQHWSLMPTHAIFSFVRPASFVFGSSGGNQMRFTSWLGNNSKGGTCFTIETRERAAADKDTGKFARLVKEIQGHMRLRASGDRHEIRQQYLPLLWTRLVKGLELHGDEPNGIEDIMELMDSYFITKDDWDAIHELGLGPQAVEKVTLSSQKKSNFTRKYNQASHPLPFMKAGGAPPPAKKGKDKPDLEEALEESDDDDVLVDVAAEDDEEELDLKKDKYVKAPRKKPAPRKAAKAKTNGEDVEENDDEDTKPKRAAGKGKRGRPK